MARKKLLGLVALAGVPFASQVLAATSNWTNANGTYSWDDSADWDAGGVPTSTSTAVFDAAGAGTITNGASDTAAQIQFGQTTETTGSSIAAFTLGGGTIAMPVATGSTIINYFGSANTATQTISSNIVLGNSGDTAPTFIINDSSGGNLNISGNISEASATADPILYFLVSPGDTVALSGSDSLVVNSGAVYGPIELGNSATAAYGNVEIANAVALPATARAGVYGTSGALQYATGGGTGIVANQENYINLESSRTSESTPQIENVSGSNVIANGGIELRTVGNDYIQSDAGLLSIGVIQAYSMGANVVYLDGAGNGTITSTINTKGTGTTVSVVKDGSGTWTYGSTVTAVAAGVGTTVAGGTLLIDSASGKELGPITVNNSGTGSATLGGSGYVGGAVTLSGDAKINPGDVGVGAANIGTLTLTGGLAVSGSGTLLFDLDSTTGMADELASTSTTNPVALGTGITTLSLDDLGNTVLPQGTTFNLVAYAGTLSGAFQNYGNNSDVTVGPNTYVLSYGTGSASDITLTVVPEPGGWFYSVSGLGLLILTQRRRGVVRA